MNVSGGAEQLGGTAHIPHVPQSKPPSNFGGSEGLSHLKKQFDPLPWSDFFDEREMIDGVVPLYRAGSQGHLFICMHGAGHSALTFAALAEKMKHECIVYAFDWRGHGDHKRDDEKELSQANLIADALAVVKFLHARHPEHSINLLGHSMGGSIATKLCYKMENELPNDPLTKMIQSIVIIDVVEGTAMEALPFMEQVVMNRPPHFVDHVGAIKYGISSGQVRDKRSARVSMPAQVHEVMDKYINKPKMVWRTDLMATKQYWTEWFTGLTQQFLDVKAKKMLFLAGSERMDKELSIAQMQGKFGMIVVRECGHVIQEDQPQQVATHILNFFGKLRLKPKYEEVTYIVNASGVKIPIRH